MKHFTIIITSILLALSIHINAQELNYPKVTIEGKTYYEYTVVAGDGLYSISRRFGISPKELNASNSSLATVSFAKGAPVEKLTLPSTLQTLELRELPLLTSSNIKFDNGGYQSVTSLVIDNCAKLKDSWN